MLALINMNIIALICCFLGGSALVSLGMFQLLLTVMYFSSVRVLQWHECTL